MERKWMTALITCQCLSLGAFAQRGDVTPLFQDEKPLPIRFSYSMKQVAKNTNDTVYFSSMLYYKNGKETWDSLKMSLRARGNFRRKNCFFAPLRIKLKKGDTKSTIFAGNKSLKLVVPCKPVAWYNGLVMKEYVCYQLYEAVTHYSFNTRLTELTLVDQSAKKSKTYPSLLGFFIEDDDLAAKRWDGKVVDSLQLHPLLLHDTSALRQAFFEFMIANTDWSTTYYHNAKIVKIGTRKYVPIAYDFDMAGLVNAPYATVNEGLDLANVTERLYRGFCRNEALTQFVRAEFIQQEPTIMKIFDQYASYFEPKEIEGMKKYTAQFFTILKSDRQFKDNIMLKCRTN
jgi:hypothetical protein